MDQSGNKNWGNPQKSPLSPPFRGEERYRIAANLIRNAITKSQAAGHFQVGIGGKESIFDALIRVGIAKNFRQAVQIAGLAFPPENSGWLELAEWVMDYEAEAESNSRNVFFGNENLNFY
ncbi:MAG: hypothetical protein KGI54_07670 [Pseudomonadota bacterium]|nr:hypothetical protein [Pseudomonadota bacterium]